MKKLLLLAIGLSLFNTATAELYKWTDENGKVHYTDKDPNLDNKKPASTEVIEAEDGNVFSADEAKTKPIVKTDTAPQATPASEEIPPPP